MSFSIGQESSSGGKGHWNWSVWLTGSPEELDRVAAVEYTLHPTFSPPVHQVADRLSSFRLDGSGWGEFMIHATVKEKDGATTTLEHWLDLDASNRARGLPDAISQLPVEKGPALPPAAAPAPGAPPRDVASPASPPAAGSDLGRGEVFGAVPDPVRPVEADGSAPRSVYLSSGLVDRLAAIRIREILMERGVAVRTGEDLQSPTESVETTIRRQLERVDGAVFVVSEREGPWVRHELAISRQLDRPVAIVMTSEKSSPPEEMAANAAVATKLSPSGDPAVELAPLVQWAVSLPVRGKRTGPGV